MEWVRKIENHCGVKLKYNFCSYTNTSNVHNWLLEAKSIDRYMTGAKMLIELNDRVNSQSGGNILSSAMAFWAIFIFFIFFLELNSYKSHLKEDFDRRKKKTYSLLTLKNKIQRDIKRKFIGKREKIINWRCHFSPMKGGHRESWNVYK